MPRARDQIYREILHFGLLHIRTAAYEKNQSICEIEADHLHNIPMLLGEHNEEKHRYYFDKERVLYIERISKTKPVDTFCAQRYEELWKELEAYFKP